MTLYQHQQKALEVYDKQTAIPLLFDPGTGKTLTALMLAKAKFERGEIDCLLVVAPNNVHKQWAVQEIPKWISEMPTTVEWRKTKKPIYVPGRLNIYCTNIEAFSTVSRWKDIKDWALKHKTMIVLDEAQSIKNPSSLRAQRLLYEFNDVQRRGRTIIRSTPKTVARIALTGTPITNSPFDVWALFEFLKPGFFGMSYYAFQSKYGMFYSMEVNGRIIRVPLTENIWNRIHECSPAEAGLLFGIDINTYNTVMSQDHYQGPYVHIDELKEKIYTLAMGATIEECVDMPAKTYIHKFVEMTSEQARIYNELEKELVAQYQDGMVEASSKMVAYVRLQQIASGFVSMSVPVPEDENAEEGNTADPRPNEVRWIEGANNKIEALLNDAKQVSGQFIVICHFTCEAQQLYEALTEAGFKVCLQTGFRKVGTIEGFQRGDYDCIVANIRVLAKGFNLQCARYMFFYSNTFSLEDRIQVEARIYRAGQTQKCIYIDYLTDATIDLKIYAALKQKRNLYEYIKDTSVKEMLTEIDNTFKETYNV